VLPINKATALADFAYGLCDRLYSMAVLSELSFHLLSCVIFCGHVLICCNCLTPMGWAAAGWQAVYWHTVDRILLVISTRVADPYLYVPVEESATLHLFHPVTC